MWCWYIAHLIVCYVEIHVLACFCGLNRYLEVNFECICIVVRLCVCVSVERGKMQQNACLSWIIDYLAMVIDYKFIKFWKFVCCNQLPYPFNQLHEASVSLFSAPFSLIINCWVNVIDYIVLEIPRRILMNKVNDYMAISSITWTLKFCSVFYDSTVIDYLVNLIDYHYWTLSGWLYL